MKVAHMVAEGDWVAVHWQASATRHRQLEKHRQLKGIEPSGEEQTTSGVTLFRLENGLSLTHLWPRARAWLCRQSS